MRVFRFLFATALCALVVFAARPGSAAYYFNDFETGSTADLSGVVSVQGTQSYSALSGFGAKFLRNDRPGDPAPATSLILSGLPTHTGVSIGFLLAIIDSWDAINCCSPDYFTVKVDGITVFNERFDNFNNGAGQSYSGPQMGGVRASRGFNSAYKDAAYDLTSFGAFQNIAHSGSTLTIQFYASGDGTGNLFQGGTDESWAIDELSVDLVGVGETQSVPEPATLALIGAGLLGFGAMRRRVSRR